METPFQYLLLLTSSSNKTPTRHQGAQGCTTHFNSYNQNPQPKSTATARRTTTDKTTTKKRQKTSNEEEEETNTRQLQNKHACHLVFSVKLNCNEILMGVVYKNNFLLQTHGFYGIIYVMILDQLHYLHYHHHKDSSLHLWCVEVQAIFF